VSTVYDPTGMVGRKYRFERRVVPARTKLVFDTREVDGGFEITAVREAVVPAHVELLPVKELP
jgi:hypothetical protein